MTHSKPKFKRGDCVVIRGIGVPEFIGVIVSELGYSGHYNTRILSAVARMGWRSGYINISDKYLELVETEFEKIMWDAYEQV